MKRVVSLALAMSLCSGIISSAEYSYKNNTYQKLAEEYSVKSMRALDAGDYLLSEEYAKKAEENAALSDEFIKRQRKQSLDSIMADAQNNLEGIDKDKALADSQVSDLYKKLQEAYEKGDLEEASRISSQLNDLLSKYKNDDAVAKDSSSNSKGSESSSEKNKKQKELDSLIASTKKNLEEAGLNRADENYPISYSAVNDLYKQMQDAYNRGDYEEAEAIAKKINDLLKQMDSINTLPRYYVVQSWEASKDCLWNIAKRPFVYNNPWLWENLYEANKNKLPRKNDPNLITPGMIIEIPSISGEFRSGTYDPKKTYDTYKPKK